MSSPLETEGWDSTLYDAQTTTVRTVKSVQCKFGGYMFFNPNATVAYMQLFDVAPGTTVTLGTTVPDMSLPLPAGAAANVEMSRGRIFRLGMKMACTTTAKGSGAPSTGLDINIYHK